MNEISYGNNTVGNNYCGFLQAERGHEEEFQKYQRKPI